MVQSSLRADGLHLGKSALDFEKRGVATRRRIYANELAERRLHVINLRLNEIAERDQRNFEKSIDQKSKPIDKSRIPNHEQIAEERDHGSRSSPPAEFSHFEEFQHRNNGWSILSPASLVFAEFTKPATRSQRIFQ